MLAFPVGFLAAKNVVPNVFAHFAVRRVLDAIRGVDVLIWALIFINVVGLGPFAGILAIAASDFGTFGKLFSEAIETADKRPVEGVVSTGGSNLHAVRFGLMPQVFPVIASQVLYYFESNTRSATIIGIVGAGGIGLHLAEQIRVLEWDKVAFLILMILDHRRGDRLDLQPAAPDDHRPHPGGAVVVGWQSPAVTVRCRRRERFAHRAQRGWSVANRSARAHADRYVRRFCPPYDFHHQLDALGGEARAGGEHRAAAEIDVDAVDHQDRAAGRELEPRRIGGIGQRRHHPGAWRAVVAHAEMRQRAGHRARRRIDARRVRKALGRQPCGADAERDAVGVAQRVDADQRRARLDGEPRRKLAVGGFRALAIMRPPAARPLAPTISEKRVRARIG